MNTSVGPTADLNVLVVVTADEGCQGFPETSFDRLITSKIRPIWQNAILLALKGKSQERRAVIL
jgi:hypothetical protein